MGQGAKGPWARISGGLPAGQGGTNVFLYPSKDPLKVAIAATSWGQNRGQCPQGNACPNRNLSLRAEITKTNFKYEDGIVKIPLTIRMKIKPEYAQQFSTNVLEDQAASAPATEQIPSEGD